MNNISNSHRHQVAAEDNDEYDNDDEDDEEEEEEDEDELERRRNSYSADEGVATLESPDVLKLQPFTDLGSPVELVRSFGGRPQYLSALQALEQALYATPPAH